MLGSLVGLNSTILILLPLGCALLITLTPRLPRFLQLGLAQLSCAICVMLCLLELIVLYPETLTSPLTSATPLQTSYTILGSPTFNQTGPQLRILLAIEPRSIPLMTVINLIFFCLIARLRSSDPILANHTSPRLGLLLLLQAATVWLWLGQDVCSIAASGLLISLLLSSLTSLWGESNRLQESRHAFGWQITSWVFLAGGLLTLATGLSIASGSWANNFGSLETALPRLQAISVRLATQNSPGIDFLRQITPWSACMLLAGLAMQCGVVPCHRWIIGIFREAPCRLLPILMIVHISVIIIVFEHVLLPLTGGVMIVLGPIMMTLAMVSSTYLAFIALAHTDLRRLLALTCLKDLMWMILGFALLEGLGPSGSWLLGLQLLLWVTLISGLLDDLQSSYQTLDSSCLGGLTSVSRPWSHWWMVTSMIATLLPILGLFPSRALIFIALCRTTFAGSWVLIVMFVLSEVLISWTWIRTTLSLLFTTRQEPIPKGPVFSRLANSALPSSELITVTKLRLSAPIICLTVLGLMVLTIILPALFLLYRNQPAAAINTIATRHHQVLPIVTTTQPIDAWRLP